MSTLKTYIVEDNPVIRENLAAALEELAPVEVVGVAQDESSAVGWLVDERHSCDLVIIDIFLKAGSGLGVLSAASHLDWCPGLVVLTNYATFEMRRRCFELGADRVFDKSNELDALIEYCAGLASRDCATPVVPGS
jgi:DNA-binding NarL/FixJ family response regulator